MSLISTIDALLPQTQCERCSYPGCLPYATAIVTQGAEINKCLPGGAVTAEAINNIMNNNIINKILPEINPAPKSIAIIDEPNCIGCTLCIQACPVDAIIGAAKQLHTVITDYCTGCELCINACPTSCISMLPIGNGDVPTWIIGDTPEFETLKKQALEAKQRFNARNARLEKQRKLKLKQHTAQTNKNTIQEKLKMILG